MPPNYAQRITRVSRELAKHESGLREWIGRCTVNAIWYLSDPIGALRDAKLGIDEAVLRELESLRIESAGRGRPARRKSS